MTWEILSLSPEPGPITPALPLLKAGARESLPARPARHSGSGRSRAAAAQPEGEPGLGRGVTAATAAGVCASRGSRAWRAGCVAMPELAVQKVVVHPWCCSVWWIISIGEPRRHWGRPTGAGGAAALLSHRRAGYAARRPGADAPGVALSRRGPRLSPFMKPKLPGVVCPAGTPGN